MSSGPQAGSQPAAILPALAENLTPEWITGALAARHPGVKVTSVEVIERHELTNAHARLRLTFDEPAGAPEVMFCKLPPSEAARRQVINATGMGRREALFYSALAPSVKTRVPAVYAAEVGEDGGFVLLLEDLVTSECLVSDGTWAVSPDAAAGALEDLADLHVRFEDPAARAAQAPWASVSTPSTSYGGPMLRYGIEHHRDRLTDSFVAITELYLSHHEKIQELWHAGPHTIIHGDPHIGNLFVDEPHGGRVGFLDWGIVNVNTPMRDVSYFLTMGMQVADRRAHERDLLRHYLELRRAAGGSEISFDEAWTAHRIHAAYNVPASCQVVTFPSDATEGRRVFADAFLERAEASINDLESLAALRQAGDL
jgi:aminoglycoside phosphotransferase (APT) family kinase protein